MAGPEHRAVEIPNLRLSPSDPTDLLQMMLNTLSSLNTVEKVQYFPKGCKNLKIKTKLGRHSLKNTKLAVTLIF